MEDSPTATFDAVQISSIFKSSSSSSSSCTGFATGFGFGCSFSGEALARSSYSIWEKIAN